MVKGMSEAIKNSPYLTGAWKQGLKEGKRVGAKEVLEDELKQLEKDYKRYDNQIEKGQTTNREYLRGLRDKTDGMIQHYQLKLEKGFGE